MSEAKEPAALWLMHEVFIFFPARQHLILDWNCTTFTIGFMKVDSDLVISKPPLNKKRSTYEQY